MNKLIDHLESLYGMGLINLVQLDISTDFVDDMMLNETFGNVGNNRRAEFDR